MKVKLIEVALPLQGINAAAAHEKMPGIGPHPRGVHHWWARRPLAACRAMLFAQLVDDPSNFPETFPTEEEQDKERARLFEILEQLSSWKNVKNETVLSAAREEIRKSCDGNLPKVLDPFSGGASISVEAQRLGLQVLGIDLNPVAVMIGKALVEIPRRFKDSSSIHPAKQQKVVKRSWSDVEGLSEDANFYGKQLFESAKKQLAPLYSEVNLKDGTNGTVIAWIWARTVASPNPVCKGAHVPLVKSFLLSSKKDKKVWVEPVIDRKTNTYTFEIKSGSGPIPEGTIGESKARCLLSDTPIPMDYIRDEGRSGRIGYRQIAVAIKGKKTRIYAPPEDLAHEMWPEIPTDIPDGEILHWSGCTNCVLYGMKNWADLFTPRQLVALKTFSDLIPEQRKKIYEDAIKAGMSNDDLSFADGGNGAKAYADAICVYLAMMIDRACDFNNAMTRWSASNEKIMNLFARQAIPMNWDFGEANILADVVGGFEPIVDYVSSCLLKLAPNADGQVIQGDSANIELTEKYVVSTDPPYYDNVPYANLADFFYIWLRRALQPIFPDIFNTMVTPKQAELIASHSLYEDFQDASEHFSSGIKAAVERMRKHSEKDFPLAIYYAFKQSETIKGGTASTGWETFIKGLIDAGCMIVGTWPIRSEQSGRLMGMDQNVLASAVVIVCRARPEEAPVATRAAFMRELQKELPLAVKKLQHSNIAPVDTAQACIGPGMAIYSKYSKVIEADGEMSVRTALELINQTLDEYFSEQETTFDSYTRFALTWFEQYAHSSGEYGDAELLATARAVSVNGVVDAGILEAKAKKVRLLKRDELKTGWDPASDDRLTIWEATQYLIRALDEGGEQAAAILLGKLGPIGNAARDLAYQLYGICERKKWSEEAAAYNGLVVVWPELHRIVESDNLHQETYVQGKLTLTT